MEWPFDPKSTADVIGGALGGAIRWSRLKLSIPDGLIALFVGGVFAYYFSSIGDVMASTIFSPFVGSAQPTKAGLGGFIVGVCGIKIADFIMEQVRSRLPKSRTEE
jgi:hypothetical protein